MVIEKAPVDSITEIQENVFILKLISPEIAKKASPGQFCNLKVSESSFPLLRRPFSICDIEGEYITFMFNIFGEGTKILSQKKKGNIVDCLGPLGHGFNYKGDYSTGIIVAGGLGVAPFPFLTKFLSEKSFISLIGGRSKKDIIDYKMKNVFIATDDGSYGRKGTVVDLLREKTKSFATEQIRIFGCGPTPMLRALKEFADSKEIDCQLSTEAAMACGFGICQGCPIEPSVGERYLLVCKDGPVFNSKDIIL